MKRKACRRATKRELKGLGLPVRRGAAIDRDEISRLWLSQRCLCCGRCFGVVAKLGEWRLRRGYD